MYIKNTLLLVLSLFLGFQTQAQTSYIIPDGKSEDVGYLYFKENLGQVQNDSLDSVPEIKFYCTQLESKLWLQEDGLVSWTTLKKAADDSLPDTNYRIDMQPFMEGDPIDADLAPLPEESTGTESNYYLPHCGTNGIEGVAHYQRITWPNIYPSIHQQVYSNNTGYKYYYIVEPGGDPNDINIVFSGQDQMVVSPTKLNFYLGQMTMTLDNAIAYEIDHLNQITPSSWTPTFSDQGNGSITIGTGTYNTSNTLVIQIGAISLPYVAAANPGSMEYSSYLTADQKDEVKKVTTNPSNGDVYMIGHTTSSRFSVAKGEQIKFNHGQKDAILFRFLANMKSENHTYLGTVEPDHITGLALDNFGYVVVSGYTIGDTLPNPVNTKPSNMLYASSFIVRFHPDLRVIQSYWFGSDVTTKIMDLEIDNNNKMFVVGEALSNTGNLPVTKLGGSSGSAYYQSTKHSSGAGTDGFIARLSTGFAIEHCTWFGGSTNDGFYDLDLDHAGNVYALMSTANSGISPNPAIGCGVTNNNQLPKCLTFTGSFTSNAQGTDDYYLAQFNSSFELVWGTWLGGPNAEIGTHNDGEMAVKVDKANTNTVYVAVSTENPFNWPQSGASGGYIVNRTANNNYNLMLHKFENHALTWHTALGCTGSRTGGVSLDIDDKQNLFVGGYTQCYDVQLSGGWCSVPGQSYLFPLCDNGAQLFVQSNKNRNGTGTYSPSGFITTFDKFNNLKWSTWFGSDETDKVKDVHFNVSQKRIYSVGHSQNTTLPIPLRRLTTVPNSHYQGTLGSTQGAMISYFNSNLSLFVEKIESNNWKINAYPNPASSWLHVDLEGQADFQLYDVSGRLLQSGKLTQEINAISTETLTSGSYLLRLKQDAKLATIKFVKE